MSATPAVTAADFDAAVLARSHDLPVVVDFWAPWCGPCRALAPTLERLAAEGAGRWLLVKVNTDENPELARRYRIQGIPAVKAFVQGKIASEFVGNQPEPEIRRFLDGLVPSPAAALIAEARRLDAQIQAHDSAHHAAAENAPNADLEQLRARSRAAWSEALALRSDAPEAILGAAAALARDGRPAEARAALARFPPSARGQHAAALSRLELQLAAPPLAAARAAHAARPNDPQARYDLALALSATDAEAALDLLLGLVKSDRTWKDDAARKAMLRIFEAEGIRSPLSDRWRAKLSAELYK